VPQWANPWWRRAFACVVASLASLMASAACAIAFLPVSDAALRARADAIVHGVVVSTREAADALGRPERVTVVRPVDVLKGSIPGDLVLHQLGGTLADGRGLDLAGSPDYRPGTQVLVFAITRPEGDYQTAEMLLGKFDVSRDAAGRLFAVPALAGSDARRAAEFHLPWAAGGSDARAVKASFGAPRELVAFKAFLRDASARHFPNAAAVGTLTPVRDEAIAPAPLLKWVGLAGSWRWNNGATAAWTLDGSVNITGGGRTEAANALAAWTNDPNSQIAYTLSSGSTPNPIHLNAPTSPCGWNTCISGAGVIGCGWASGSGSNVWRGDAYNTITSGEVWVRSYCTTNAFSSSVTQWVVEHELGHTLGLGHSDQGMSPHDVCIGDEDDAVMVSVSNGASSLGTDDTDAIRWLYGDGGNSCSSRTLDVSVGATARGSVTSNPAGIACPGTCSAIFARGTAVALTETPASGSVFAGWWGDASGATRTAQVAMSVDRDVVAAFDNLAHPEVFPRGCTLPTTGWTNSPSGATTGWRVTNTTSSEGDCSLQSGAMSSGTGIDKAQIQFAGTFTAGNVTFDRRVSSEPGYDCFRFLIDAVPQNVQGSCTGSGGPGASGEVAWGAVAVPVTAGTHTLTWSYEKDTTLAQGADAAWIDKLTLPLATLSLSPGSVLDLGDVPMGVTSGVRTVTVSNASFSAVAISGIAATGDFAVSDDCGTSVPASGTCSLHVTLTPTQAGLRQGTLTVHTSSAGDFAVALSGYAETASPPAGTAMLVPLVAQTTSFTAETYVHNASATAITLTVDFYESDDSSVPGKRACNAFVVPANATRLLALTQVCTLGTGAHFGMLALHEVTGTHAFTAFARTQTPAGVGFTVEGRPLALFESATAFVDGLKRSSAAPYYVSNCFVAALGTQVGYRIDLFTSDGRAIGTPLIGSLQPNHMLRYLDVVSLAGAPAGDYTGVRAKFTETSPGNVPFVAFCTMQESVTFSADYRIAKADDAAAPTVVVPLVAHTASYATETYVHNAGAGAITLNVSFFEADNSSVPGARTCDPLSIPGNATRLLAVAPQCGLDTRSHFGMLVVADAAVPKSHPFTLFSRTQTPEGVGFSVEGFPIGGFAGAPGSVEGLKRASSGAHYVSNCFVGALDASVGYRIDLVTRDGAAIGSPLQGSLAPHHMLRFLDVLAAAGVPTGDYAEVIAKFSETTAGTVPFVGFCTMQESVTFGADFRIAE